MIEAIWLQKLGKQDIAITTLIERRRICRYEKSAVYRCRLSGSISEPVDFPQEEGLVQVDLKVP